MTVYPYIRDNGLNEFGVPISDEHARALAQGYMEPGCDGINAVAQGTWAGEDTHVSADDILAELAREWKRIDTYEFPGQTKRELFALVRWVCHVHNVTDLPDDLVVLANSLGCGVKITFTD